jgi:transposase, IS5 family
VALAYSDGGHGGRPPFDPVKMFKVLVIQAANNLSDERAELLANDRLSFRGFWVWACRTASPTRIRSGGSGRSSPRLRRSSRYSSASIRRCATGYIEMGGQIVDASLVAAPKQRNHEAEKKTSPGVVDVLQAGGS